MAGCLVANRPINCCTRQRAAARWRHCIAGFILNQDPGASTWLISAQVVARPRSYSAAIPEGQRASPHGRGKPAFGQSWLQSAKARSGMVQRKVAVSLCILLIVGVALCLPCPAAGVKIKGEPTGAEGQEKSGDEQQVSELPRLVDVMQSGAAEPLNAVAVILFPKSIGADDPFMQSRFPEAVLRAYRSANACISQHIEDGEDALARLQRWIADTPQR